VVGGVVATTEREFGFEIFNLGESEATSLKDLVSLIEKATGKTAKMERLSEQPGDVPCTFADVRKSRRMLGYVPKTRISEGIPRFVEWFKKERLPLSAGFTLEKK